MEEEKVETEETKEPKETKETQQQIENVEQTSAPKENPFGKATPITTNYIDKQEKKKYEDPNDKFNKPFIKRNYDEIQTKKVTRNGDTKKK